MATGGEGPHAEDTFAKLLRAHATLRGTRPAFRLKDLGLWQTWSWGQVYQETRAIAQGLIGLGLKPGETIAIVGANRPRLYWSITAAQMVGAVPVPVYADAVADEIAAVLLHSDATIIVAQDQEQVDKILSVRDRLPRLARLLYDEPRGLGDYDEPGLAPLAAVAAKGRAALADPAVAASLDRLIDAGKGSDPSVILYTSGTTGRSKGVVLSGERSIRAARQTVAFDRLTDRDEALAYLPLAWVGDHYLNYAQGYVAGFCIACPESAETAASDLSEIGPTYHFAPPRVFEALLTRVQIRMEDAGAVKRWLFRVFMEVARRWGEKIANGEAVPLSARLAYRLGDLLIYAPLKNALGFSRIRVAYTAGEAIGADLFAFYRSIGLNLKQLYGQTEAFLFVTAQTDRAVRSDAVGPPAPSVDLRITESGEVQFKSPGMFVGYFREDDKTREAMTDDGYVKTGDAGFFDADGQLKIIDRAKDVGRLRGGQMFAPKYIENKLKFFPEIREAVAIGDGRDFVAAMINIELASVGNWAERNNVAYASYQELAANGEVYAMIEKRVDAVNRALSLEPVMAGAQIRRFLILPKELDPDDGEVTRTQKVRRGFVAERYASLIEGLYGGLGEASIRAEITYEDGRKGKLDAWARIVDLAPYPPKPRALSAAKKGRRRVTGQNDDILLAVEHVSLSFGGVRAISDVSFDIRKGEVRAIIGPNGAGKTSMLNVVNGFYHPQQGAIRWRGQARSRMKPYEAAAQGIARTFQNVALFKGMTTLDNIMTGRSLKMRRNIFWQAMRHGPALDEEIEHRRVCEEIIDFLEIEHIRKTAVGALPYGLQKRVELGRALAMEPVLLLLDEPMAGMNREEKEDMSRFIVEANRYRGATIALIEHDIGVVMDLSDRVVVLDYGRKIADDVPDAVKSDKKVIGAYLGVGQ